MTPEKHTPGPWRVGAFFDIVDGEGRKLANAFRPSRISAEENLANAEVMAAGPDMLGALLHADEACAQMVGPDEWPRKEIRAAIAKARGGAA